MLGPASLVAKQNTCLNVLHICYNVAIIQLSLRYRLNITEIEELFNITVYSWLGVSLFPT